MLVGLAIAAVVVWGVLTFIDYLVYLSVHAVNPHRRPDFWEWNGRN